MSRGYYEDALYYIGQARKRRGDTPDLLYKAYIINKRMGNERTANGLLTRLYERSPQNEEVADALSRLRLDQARRLMDDGAYADARFRPRDTRVGILSHLYLQHRSAPIRRRRGGSGGYAREFPLTI